MKKLIAIVLTLALLLSATSALADAELSFLRIGTDAAERDYWTWVIEQFEAANPGVTVAYDEAAIGADMDTKLNTLFAAGCGPDVIGHGILSVAQRVEMGQYQAIDSYFDAWEGKDDLLPSVLANGTYKDHVYGLGYSVTPYVFAYRKDLLDEAGLKVPTTWSELAETARALTQKDENGSVTFSGFCFPTTGGNLVELDVFVFGNGGRWMDDASNPTMTGEEKVEALTFLKGLLPDVNMTYSNSETNPFVKGMAAMTLINNVGLTTMMSDPEYEGKVGIALPPANDGHEQATFSGCNMLFIGSDSTHQDEAFSFISYALSQESTLKRAEMTSIPVTLGSLSEQYAQMDPWNQARLDCVAHGTGMPRATWATQFQTIRNNLVQSVLFGEDDPEAALAKAQEDLLFEIEG